ncbi:MAG: hypothetical protein AB3N13_00410 [Arenibacterium sp.]
MERQPVHLRMAASSKLVKADDGMMQTIGRVVGKVASNVEMLAVHGQSRRMQEFDLAANLAPRGAQFRDAAHLRPVDCVILPLACWQKEDEHGEACAFGQ